MRTCGRMLSVGMFIVCMSAMVAMAQQPLPLQPLSAGSVSGVVRMVDGTPAAGVRVTAMRADAGEAVTAMASLTQTDAMGQYRLEGIPPGRYYVSAGRVDLPTFYPGTLNRTQGTVISIATAATVANVDFVIQGTSATPAPSHAFSFNHGQHVQAPGIAAPFPPSLPHVPFATAFSANLNALRDRVLHHVQGGIGALADALQPGAAWWTNNSLVARLGLTADQKRKIETIFEQRRQTILQNKTDLEREETSLAQMLNAEPLDAPRAIAAEIDKVIQARGEMERTTANMTLEMRQVLTRAQWEQLRMLAPHATPLPAPSNTLPRH